MSNKGCQYIPLKKYRSSNLLDFLVQIIPDEPEVDLKYLYEQVLMHFGETICKPDIMCLNYKYPHPEYMHQIRFSLEAGRRRKVLFGLGNGVWIKYPNDQTKLKTIVSTELGNIIQRQTKKLEINPDVGHYIDDLKDYDIPSSKSKKLINVFNRNAKIAKDLKTLYQNKCQICKFTFQKENGEFYSESHHIIPLSENGLDKRQNLIVVCANCHRELHLANVKLGKLLQNTREVIINNIKKQITYDNSH